MVPVGVAATLALAACGTLAWKVFRPKGVVYGSDALVMQCLFCDIAHGRTDPAKGGRPADQRLQGRLLHETADVAVFCNLAVHAHLHLLAIPKQHLQNISVLGPEHIPLLQQLKAAGVPSVIVTATKPNSTNWCVLGSPPPAPLAFCHSHILAPPTFVPRPVSHAIAAELRHLGLENYVNGATVPVS